MKTQKELDDAAERCYSTCSDYSCARSGHCTGGAGHAADQNRERYRALREQEKADLALADQIRRLKKAGLV